MVEQLICNQQVGGSSPSTSSTLSEANTGVFPSGQRGQTVNLLAMPTVVRIHPPPPEKRTASLRSFFLFCALRFARLKVSSTFSKVVESRGKASGRPPQRAEPPICSHKRRRGSKGEPSPGVPPFICSLGLYGCAVFLGSVLWPLLPIPPHFFALAQRNGVEPQRNALLGAATGAVASRPPLPRTRSPNITANCVKLTLPGQLTNQPQANLTHQFVPLGLMPNGRGGWAHQGDVEASKALFFGGSTPFLWASTKEMGSKGSRG